MIQLHRNNVEMEAVGSQRTPKTKLNSGFRRHYAFYEYSTTVSERISFHFVENLVEKYQQIGLSGR
jgi:hypothetical protein